MPEVRRFYLAEREKSSPALSPAKSSLPLLQRLEGLTEEGRRLFFAGAAALLLVIAMCVALPLLLAPDTAYVTVNDNGTAVTVASEQETVGGLLSGVGITLSTGDTLDCELTDAVRDGMTVTIYRAMSVTVITGSESVALKLPYGRVEDAIAAAGITMGENDEVYPLPNEYLTPGMTIQHFIVDKQYETVNEQIGYAEVTKNSSSLTVGKTRVAVEGSPGVREITVEVTKKNGNEVAREEVASVVVVEPVDKVIEVGTKPKPTPTPTPKKTKAPSASKTPAPSGDEEEEATPVAAKVPTVAQIHSSGSAAEHKAADPPDSSIIAQVLVADEVTAYCANGRTASGAYTQLGTISIYWKILPRGTKIYIPGYGYGVVEDQGGNTDASNIDVDVWLPTSGECSKWGRKRGLEIYVLG